MTEPTAPQGNPQTPATTDPASPPSPADLPDQVISSIPLDRLVASHPEVKGLQEKHAAAELEASRWKGRVEKINKAAADEDKPKPPEGDPAKPKPEPQFVTKDELWERDNARRIALVGDEFKKLVEQGVPRDVALEHALLKKGYADEKAVQEALRQAETSSAPSMVDRSGRADTRTPEQKAYDEKMGITPEDRAKYGERAKNMVTVVRG